MAKTVQIMIASNPFIFLPTFIKTFTLLLLLLLLVVHSPHLPPGRVLNIPVSDRQKKTPSS